MIANALKAHAAGNKREWKTDRSLTIGASEIGQCARRVFFDKNEGDPVYGVSRDPDFEERWGARARGSAYEAVAWEPALRASFGDRLLFAGSDQRTLVDGFLSATPDGLVVGLAPDALAHLGVPVMDSDCVVLECKTADPRTRLDGAKPEHVYQVQVQIGLIRKLTNHQPTHAIISYTDTSFWDDIREFVVAYDPDVFATACERARDIMTARSAAETRPEGHIAGAAECAYCPWTAACGHARADRVPKDDATPLDPATQDRIVQLARTVKNLKAHAETLTEDAKALEQEIKDALATAGVRKMKADGVSVSWSPLAGRSSYDMKGLKAAAEAAGVDLSSFEKAGHPTDRLEIRIG